MRRALVVDDSRLARVAHKKQLEEYDIGVDLADSAEEALDFLKREHVDVIFMDHIMPGMDGLSAVKALKGNPETATIPVMMYTSKEGELYVSQARALGAVDVLPKQTQPGVLFGMLLKLGLVRDRRKSAESATDGQDVDSGAEAAPQEEAPGMAVPALLERILEDQRSLMRSDLISSQRSFAQQVANEVYERQRDDFEALRQREPDSRGVLGAPVLAGILAVSTALLAILFATARSERDAARDALLNEQFGNPAPARAPSPASLAAAVSPDAGRGAAGEDFMDALTWALNETGGVPFGEVPFNAERGEQLLALMDRLVAAGFEGTIRIESHLGEYCLAVDANGLYRLADPDTPVSGCALIGHPLDDSSSLAERQTPRFETMAEDALLTGGEVIDLELVANDRPNSLPRIPYPVNAGLAGDWNRIAAEHNRVEYSLIAAAP